MNLPVSGGEKNDKERYIELFLNSTMQGAGMNDEGTSC